MNVICLNDEAFYALIEKVLTRIRKQQEPEKDKWVDEQEAMRLLKIKSKTTLRKIRNNGEIEFTQHSRKQILYNVDSIAQYHERHKRRRFSSV